MKDLLFSQSLTTMSKLTNNEQDTCTYTGVFGILLSATCLIQHMIFMTQAWIAYAMIGVYLVATIAFILLALQKAFAPYLLIISAVLVLLTEVFHILTLVFSAVVILLLIYHIIIITVLFVGNYPQKLKAKALALKEEELSWRDKL
jgi:hypothetical protein